MLMRPTLSEEEFEKERDRGIALIRAAKTPEVAKVGLVSRFELTEIQADEILKLQLQRLKKRKLQLKDAIARLESLLIPDLGA